MSQIIREQIYFQITTICAGMFMMFGYDILRLWRWMIPHGRLWVWIEDLLYWSLLGIPVFVLFFSDDRRRAALVRDSRDACRRYFV